MSTNNTHMNMKPIPLLIKSINSDNILSINNIDGFFKIDILDANTLSNIKEDTYIKSVDDLLTFIDVYVDLEETTHGYIIGFRNMFTKSTNKDEIKNKLRILV